jgi:Ca2+-dependent lipid-binding protein
MNITLSAKVGGSKFAVPVPLRVYVSDLRIAGKFRLGLFWTRRKGGPYLRRLRVSFVDVPEHSVVIKPMTSSFIDVRDLPGVDSAIENALNKLFTNVLVEPNCVNWDVEKWWINRPAAQPPRAGALGPDGSRARAP